MSRAENFYKEKIKSTKDRINILDNSISYIGWSRLAIVLVGIAAGYKLYKLANFLNFILVNTWKENATAFTTLVAEGIMLCICGWKSREICKVKVFNRNLFTVCIGTIIVAGICFIVKMAEFQSIAELLISVILSGISYFIVLIALKNESVIKMMKRVLKIKE